MSSSPELAELATGVDTVGAQTGAPDPWTRAELQAALRRAGWKRMDGPAACYVSPAGTRFHLDDYISEVGVLWRYYAARRVLPGKGK